MKDDVIDVMDVVDLERRFIVDIGDENVKM